MSNAVKSTHLLKWDVGLATSPIQNFLPCNLQTASGWESTLEYYEYMWRHNYNCRAVLKCDNCGFCVKSLPSLQITFMAMKEEPSPLIQPTFALNERPLPKSGTSKEAVDENKLDQLVPFRNIRAIVLTILWSGRHQFKFVSSICILSE